jgi:hypothetical protein
MPGVVVSTKIEILNFLPQGRKGAEKGEYKFLFIFFKIIPLRLRASAGE